MYVSHEQLGMNYSAATFCNKETMVHNDKLIGQWTFITLHFLPLRTKGKIKKHSFKVK